MSKNFEAINEILKERGAMSVGLLRLTFFPYGLCSYVLGVTDISPSDFMLGTATYLINCLMQVFIGAELYHMQEVNGSKEAGSNIVEEMFFVIQMLVGCSVSLTMAYFAKKMI